MFDKYIVVLIFQNIQWTSYTFKYCYVPDHKKCMCSLPQGTLQFLSFVRKVLQEKFLLRKATAAASSLPPSFFEDQGDRACVTTRYDNQIFGSLWVVLNWACSCRYYLGEAFFLHGGRWNERYNFIAFLHGLNFKLVFLNRRCPFLHFPQGHTIVNFFFEKFFSLYRG